jgi:hypothetical protein
VTDWLRRAGRGRQPDRSEVTWSVAEGSHGRRWRWTVVDADRLRHVGLVEVDRDGRFARLELSSARGQLTLHPEPDHQSIHGNVASADGVRPLAFDWSPVTGLAIAGDAFGSAILPHTADGPTLVVSPRLGVVSGRVDGSLECDGRGIPILEQAVEWPLEE